MDFAAQYKIRINPIGLAGHPANTYKMKVNKHLNLIYGTKVGRILLDCIRFHGLPVDISPYTGAGCNSGGGWTTVPAGTRQGFATYSPDTFAPHGACSAALGTSGRLGHEILFHELVHAFRGVSGKWNTVALGLNLKRYTDSEEFLAVLLTNIFISDGSNKQKSSLRADHTDYQSLAPDFVAPFSFFESSSLVLPLVKKFVEENHPSPSCSPIRMSPSILSPTTSPVPIKRNSPRKKRRQEIWSRWEPNSQNGSQAFFTKSGGSRAVALCPTFGSLSRILSSKQKCQKGLRCKQDPNRR